MIYNCNSNKIQHLELLKRFLDLESQGKNLYTENRNEFVKLQTYRSIVSDNVFWKSKQQFLLLMENYVNDWIDLKKFEFAFSELWFSRDESIKLKFFLITPRLKLN